MSYTVSFRHDDEETFSEDTNICDGSQQATMDSRTCTIASSRFTEEPYNLAWGSSIYAKVYATNIKGVSIESLSGNGAIILRIPDVPVSLSNVPEITSATTIGLVWLDGADNGGTAIIDYTMSYAEENGSYETLEVAITEQTYTAISLTSGVVYKFKV